jgi:hypothetical protein
MLERLIGVSIVSVLLAVAGCGGETQKPASLDGTVEQALNGKGPEPRCSTVLSARFVRETYGSAAACKTVEAKRTDTELHDGRAAAPQVTGDSATVQVTLPTDASGVMRLRREAGAWKVDRYEDDLLHALFDGYLLEQVKLTASKPGLNESGAASCVDDKVEAMGADGFRRFAYGALGNRPEAETQLKKLIPECLTDPRSGSGGESYLRPYLEDDIVKAAQGEGYDSEAVECIRRKFASVSDRQILEHVTRDKSAPPPATEEIAALIGSCR